MIVAHLSDLHLGFRAYGRVERGTDVRERDVATAFERAVQELVRVAPDVVVVAGDVFDRPNPPAGALVVLSRGLELLRASLPHTPVLMVAGPRDTPRRPGDPGALAVLDTFPNVEAATALARSIIMERLDLHVSLVPYRSVVREPVALPEPEPRVRWNLLVVHGSIGARGERGVPVDPRDWSYVALGGEHRRRSLGTNIQYPGSLERVALDPWDEAADEKGFLLVDLERKESLFHPIAGRAVVALAPIRVLPGDPERLRRRVREVTAEVPGGIDGKIVRLRLDGIEPEELIALQGEQLDGLRRRALHLTVEVGSGLHVPQEAWLSADSPRLVRDALEAELERDGVRDAAAVELADGLVRDADGAASAGPLGTLNVLEGEIPGVGRASTSILPGITAIIGGLGRARRAVAGFVIREAVGGGAGPLTDLWAGRGGETLDGALHQAVEAVAGARGLHVVDVALERARALGGEASGSDTVEGAAAIRNAVRVDAARVAAELRAAEREQRAMRADAVELGGDLEVATMDWLRERQDAETTLGAYRDRARELKGRLRRLESGGPEAPCPTCGRILQSHYDEVLRELKEEWEGVVQDGSWWRRRREQLELKPVHLQELESRSVRLHATLDASLERVELLRARLGEMEEAADGAPLRTAAPTGGPMDSLVAALRRLREARLSRARTLLLARASRYIGRISGGRILAITWSGGTAHLQGDSGPLSPLSEEDLAAGRLALRLGAASLVAVGGQVLASLLVEEPFDRLDMEARLRTLVLLRELLQEIPTILLFSRGEAVDARPELFDAILELRDDALGGASPLRPAHAGAGRVLLSEPAPPIGRRVSQA